MQRGTQYIYTQHSDEAIAQLVQTHYLGDRPIRCRFYVSGLHDNYLIEQSGKKFILRVYRADWRNETEVQFELELLNFLQQKQAPVAGPVTTQDGLLSAPIESPEGMRLAALFQYAEGHAPEAAITTQQCQLLGRTVAEVHHMADDFVTEQQRPELEFGHLVEEPIALYSPYLDSDARAYLQQLLIDLRRQWPCLEKGIGVYGVCTGDINARNFHITDQHKISLFDFDQCGFGYRAFEIAKFASSIHFHGNKQQLLAAFLAGYQQVRQLTTSELDAIPVYEIAAVIWVLGIAAKNVGRIGFKYMEKPYWSRKLDILKTLQKKKQ